MPEKEPGVQRRAADYGEVGSLAEVLRRLLGQERRKEREL
jgi:hypothetical protein